MFVLLCIIMQASAKTLHVQNQSEKFYVTHLDLFRTRIRNQVKKQQSHRHLYLPDIEIFRSQDRTITLEKGSVQDACYDATFLIFLLSNHKGLVCKNTAVGVDDLAGRTFSFEVLCILAYYVCQTGPIPTVYFHWFWFHDIWGSFSD